MISAPAAGAASSGKQRWARARPRGVSMSRSVITEMLASRAAVVPAGRAGWGRRAGRAGGRAGWARWLGGPARSPARVGGIPAQRAFRLLFAAQSISSLGDRLVPVALA